MAILLQDDFTSTSGSYTLKDGQISPNGKWKNIYNGYGSSGSAPVSSPKNGRTGSCFFTVPKVNQQGTSACLVLSQAKFTDFDTTFWMRTFSHTRTNPENWETAWIMFRYNDNTHHYYMYIQRNGTVEIGKKDYVKVGTTQVKTPDGVIHNVDNQDRQQFLFTEAKVAFALQKWFKIRLVVKGYNIKLWIDDVLKADIIDDGTRGTDGITGKPLRWKPSAQMLEGKIGFYVEDAKGEFDNIIVQSV